MKKEDVEKLELGIYKINWIMCQGFSIASIGMLANGEKWVAPTNWTEPELNQGVWDKIESVELIISQFDFKKSEKTKTETEAKPEKIQTAYEWMKERFDLLKRNPAAEPFWKELDELEEWLKENKPENWVQCTKKNTKAGDEVRNKQNKRLYIIEHIYREYPCCSVWNPREEKTVLNFKLDCFEINIAEKE